MTGGGEGDGDEWGGMAAAVAAVPEVRGRTRPGRGEARRWSVGAA